MEYKVYKKSELTASKWTGGTTTQLAIFPADSVYMERNFVWRLSTATCDAEESTFSRLPDFDRVLMVLEGDVVLAHQDVRAAKLGELEQDSFDGAYHTKSFGKIVDYNLMVKKGNRGALAAISLSSENTRLECEKDADYGMHTVAFYVRDGFCTADINGETIMLMPGDQLVIDMGAEEKPELSVMGEGTLIRADIWYNYEADEMRPVEIPPEKATFRDFLTCMYLANVQFRGASFFFKRLKKEWNDEALSKAIKKVESIYLTFFIALLGGCVVLGLTINRLSGAMCILAVLLWLVFDMLVISPLIYMAVVPKPVRKHIKSIDSLTPYEQKVRERELGTNERLDKIMKKYEKTGKRIDEMKRNMQ